MTHLISCHSYTICPTPGGGSCCTAAALKHGLFVCLCIYEIYQHTQSNHSSKAVSWGLSKLKYKPVLTYLNYVTKDIHTKYTWISTMRNIQYFGTHDIPIIIVHMLWCSMVISVYVSHQHRRPTTLNGVQYNMAATDILLITHTCSQLHTTVHKDFQLTLTLWLIHSSHYWALLW